MSGKKISDHLKYTMYKNINCKKMYLLFKARYYPLYNVVGQFD